MPDHRDRRHPRPRPARRRQDGRVVTKPDGSTRTITARHAVVLDTGSSAAVPDIDGLRAARPWISRDVTNIHTIPQRVVIIGGGVVACEAATWLNGLGVEELTIVEGEPRLLSRNEPFAGELVADYLRGAGVTVELGTRLTAVSRPQRQRRGLRRSARRRGHRPP